MTLRKLIIGIIICTILSVCIRVALNNLIEKPIGKVEVIHSEVEVIQKN